MAEYMISPDERGPALSPVSKVKTLLSGGPVAVARRIIADPTLRTTMIFGLSGLAFALGNLFLARTMSVDAFGKFALAIALFNVFGLLTPLGIDQAILRHRIDPGPRLLLMISTTGILVGLAIGAVFWLYTDVHSFNLWALALSIASGGVITTLMALARAQHREYVALLLATFASWALLAIGIASFVFPMSRAFYPIALFGIANFVAAVIGWILLSKAHRVPHHERASIPWAESWSLLGIATIGTLTLQLERLIIPPTIGLPELALFSVLASVAIFPFRLLTASAGFSLVPKLRAATCRQEKLTMIRRELMSVGILTVLSSLCIVMIVPTVTDLFTGGRYQIGFGLALAACMNGYSKVMQTFPRALITACGSDQEIARLNRLGWIGLCTSVIGGFIGAQWALTGLLYGVAIGSMVGTIPAMALARRVLK
jgi:O-antigen/teichoic acid export membrane protein